MNEKAVFDCKYVSILFLPLEGAHVIHIVTDTIIKRFSYKMFKSFVSKFCYSKCVHMIHAHNTHA